jgi:formyl-CoA transferase
VKSPKLGEIRIVDQAVKLSRTPASIATAPPELGEHTAEVLEELGYSAAAIEELRKKKVV